MKKCSKCEQTKGLEFFSKNVSSPDGFRSSCKQCHSLYYKKYVQVNSNQVKESKDSYRDVNKESLREKNKEYYLVNKERILKRNRETYDPNHQRAKYESWVANSPDKYKEFKHSSRRKRRAKIKGANGSHTLKEINVLFDNQGRICNNPHCQIKLNYDTRSLDHITPLSKGGSNGVENLQWLCSPCNDRKHVKSWGEFLATEAARGNMRKLADAA